MKGGNEVRKANVVTLCSKGAYQIDEAITSLGWRPSLGALQEQEIIIFAG